MDLELEGKSALVTGGSRGIGKAVASALAAEGANVAIAARNREVLEETAFEIGQATGATIIPIGADITSVDDVESMVKKAVSAFSTLDILVNNAGQAGGLAIGPLASVTDEAMQMDLNTKFMGALRCARSAAPFMQKRGWGRIINIGGLSARASGMYSTGIRNIAIVHLSKSLADELGPAGITVNVVHPGPTRNTGFVDNLVASRVSKANVSPDEAERQLAQNNAIRRFPDAHDIANIVAFLASPKSSAITGEVIGAGGGSSRAVFT